MKTIRFRGTQVNFPDACSICLEYAHQPYRLERVFTFGRNSLVLNLNVPLCHRHHKLATSKTPAQAQLELLSPFMAILPGAVVAIALLWYWSESEQGTLLLNIPLALVVGACFAVLDWAITLFWIAPQLASPETKAVLHAIRMTKYDPVRNELELTLENDTAAELVARENLSTLILDAPNLKQYRISAHILDHDIRYNNTLSTRVLLDHTPAEKEAIALLQPVIDKTMVQQMGVDTFYDIDSVKIEEIKKE